MAFLVFNFLPEGLKAIISKSIAYRTEFIVFLRVTTAMLFFCAFRQLADRFHFYKRAIGILIPFFSNF